mmetsp:Transcript_11321/g.18943  ORF Transcript_11321/g.18943 Transcript_11321/m.18943 type:complete len:217 (+) Transcript_11321:14-664(+)|eukprot:CAMPEP_0119317160 /NCGR_PEP_ID=MMETSP1333-20130426/42174_1 /TAXON_ID=418940 /ORGANISM="Scyphosphaera apsteinii, Strain RCC1455" /LENGTH=216 /DNA_ID=CAMNT_0007323017 /DNA_START=14 /DNA_END=664 /DNA_ORIENTATION=-
MADKIAAGRERKAAKAAAAKQDEEAKRQAKEDSEWEDGTKKCNKKQEADAERKARARDRKAAAQEQEAEENSSMSKAKGKKDKQGGKSKMTRAEIAAKVMREQDEKAKADAKLKKQIEASGGNEYVGLIQENTNRDDGIDASGVDAAIGALDMASSSSPATPRGRVNLKAAYAAFEEREMPQIKQDHPGLKLSQYKELLWKAWQKSPENPQNAESG